MHREPDFGDEQWAAAIEACDVADDGLKQWMRNQVARGQDYYFNRIRQLAPGNGSRALDAGCGMGNWALALARLFDSVDAIDVDKVRVDALNAVVPQVAATINTRYGSIEELPYPDEAFDFLFCNGVIFLTDVPRTLAEFARVVRPGGRVYVTFNSAAWWRHLLVDRAPDEPVCRIYGANGLLGALRYRMQNCGTLSPENGRQLALECAGILRVKYNFLERRNAPLTEMATALCERITSLDDWDSVVLPLATAVEAGLNGIEDPSFRGEAAAVVSILRLLVELGPIEQQQNGLAESLMQLIAGVPWQPLNIITHSFESHHMAAEFANHGFERISVAPEGCLKLDTDVPSVPPIYAKRLGVLELLATRCR